MQCTPQNTELLINNTINFDCYALNKLHFERKQTTLTNELVALFNDPLHKVWSTGELQGQMNGQCVVIDFEK